jgi:hypothetical protein
VLEKVRAPQLSPLGALLVQFPHLLLLRGLDAYPHGLHEVSEVILADGALDGFELIAAHVSGR